MTEALLPDISSRSDATTFAESSSFPVDYLSNGFNASDRFQDHLTGIGNRRFFEHQLEASLGASHATSLPVTVLLLDLDRFKAVNDSLGHAVGDALLILVAERISSVLRPGDNFGRLGGDEFGILPGPDTNATALAAQLVDLIQRTFLVEGFPVNIGVSLGIATSRHHEDNRANLMRRADLALYHAKASGRSCFVVFDPEMETRAQARREMELGLRKALPLRQMELHFRPQIDARTRRLIGLEAMLFWQHPKQGLLKPSAFLPLAEEIGVVVPLGEWTIKAVCREAARWPDDVTIAVNVSSVQFEGERFFETVTKALEAAGIPGHRLEIEVTESILLRDGKSVVKMLNNLRSIGVRVAIDSFGTGIASLSQMVEFPLDTIKIDRSLVAETGTGAKERAIVRAIAALGDSLGISTLVEGVDTLEHLARIQKDGCSSVQGYLHSHPVPAAELKELVGTLLSIESPETNLQEAR